MGRPQYPKDVKIKLMLGLMGYFICCLISFFLVPYCCLEILMLPRNLSNGIMFVFMLPSLLIPIFGLKTIYKLRIKYSSTPKEELKQYQRLPQIIFTIVVFVLIRVILELIA